jgi:hypothetical protein
MDSRFIKNVISRILGRGLKKSYYQKKSFLSRLMLLDRKNIFVKRCMFLTLWHEGTPMGHSI